MLRQSKINKKGIEFKNCIFYDQLNVSGAAPNDSYPHFYFQNTCKFRGCSFNDNTLKLGNTEDINRNTIVSGRLHDQNIYFNDCFFNNVDIYDNPGNVSAVDPYNGIIEIYDNITTSSSDSFESNLILNNSDLDNNVGDLTYDISFPSYSSITSSTLVANEFNIPNTKVVRYNDWVVSGIDVSLWGSNRYGAGAFYFGDFNCQFNLKDSVLVNFRLVDKLSDGCTVSMHNDVFNNTLDVIYNKFNKFGINCQFDWAEPTNFPFIKDKICYGDTLTNIINERINLQPFSGINIPPNPGIGYSEYIGYETGLFGNNRADYVLNLGYDIGIGRGVFGGGAGSNITIDYVTIATLGNAVDFGDLTIARHSLGGCASQTRGIFGGGDSSTSDVIDYVTIVTFGNAIDFGDLSVARYSLGVCSNSTRGIFAGGYTGSINSNVIDYITIATLGNAASFGALTIVIQSLVACSSPTRGIFAGGYTTVNSNVISYVSINSTGNAVDFGDLTVNRRVLGACSNSTRGIFAGGYTTVINNTIDYVEIATTGNAVDFGDLSVARHSLAACSNSTRGLFAGGWVTTYSNVIDSVTIPTLGNAVDFGDLSVARQSLAAFSDVHGGL